tara:strand:+ start:262 stop:1149 length:888 start_codon:yes stop_codon:yes gene_type:complete
MNVDKVYILEDRGILYINGEDCFEFLQNLITNDLNKVSEDNSCFASLLTPQGKYLFDFMIVKHKEGYFIDCEKKVIDELFKKLDLYKLRSKVEILNLSNEFVVAAISKEKFLVFENSKDVIGNTIKYRSDPIFLDPRNTDLGGRMIINLEKLYLSIKKLDLKSSNIKEYYDHSFNIGIPQIDTQKLQNKLFGIECNFEDLNGLDFKKGCYVGQENTARIKLKDKQSKKLFPIKILEGKIKMNDEIKQNNKVYGNVLIDQSYPFGLIKFKDNDIKISENFSCGTAKIKILKPNWLK